jgi:hypothetical protein
VLGGHALGGGIEIPFLRDIEAHARFLVALPALIIAELEVQIRVSPLVRRFVERGIVVTEDLPAYYKTVNTALRVRNSVAVESLLLVLVYTVGQWIWRSQVAMGGPTWYATPDATHLNLTLAGYWFAFVSIPLFQFILLRWYMRFMIWFWFLWRVSRLNLHLTAAHPDRAGGIGFLGTVSYAFGPILFAQGALVAGVIADRVLYDGQSLLSFKLEAAAWIGLFVLIIFCPLAMFTAQLSRTKRRGSAEYGLLANRYLFGFEAKWIGGGSPETSELLGTADLQSLADLGNSYSFVRQMRLVPFGPEDVARMAAIAAAPLLPLTLMVLSAEEVLTRLVKVLF